MRYSQSILYFYYLLIYISTIYFLSFPFFYRIWNAPSISFLMALITSVQFPIQSHSRRIFRNARTQAVYRKRIRRNLFRATALPTFPTSKTYFRKHSAQFLLLNFRLESLPPYGGSFVPLAASPTFWQVGSDRDASKDFDQLRSRSRARARAIVVEDQRISCYERTEIRLDS